jgi:acyl-CoA synthetase (AMP-forming)/AMP-acid ligase II
MAYHPDLLAEHPAGEPDAQIDEDDPVFIIYTSGTTGLPRGALYTHRNAMDNTRTFVIMKGLQREDKHITIMPLFHIGGIDNLNACFYVGSSNVIMKFFDPAAMLQAIHNERATDIQIVATHLAAIFDLPEFDSYDLSSLKRIYYVGSPMPVELLKTGLASLGPIFLPAMVKLNQAPISVPCPWKTIKSWISPRKSRQCWLHAVGLKLEYI